MSDPRQTLDQAPMSRLQIIAVAIAIALNALDGFDVLAISFASPGILAEWGINRAQLGVVLSAELIGMGIGSLFLGSLADKIGRRPMMLLCLVIMASGMFAVTTVNSITMLLVWRAFTGIGIGGMLAATNAVAAEFSNNKRRNLCIALMASGYPVGAVIGGEVVKHLLVTHTWRSIFYLGAAATALLIPVVWALVPEPVHWLTTKRPANALEKINRTLARMGHAAISALPDATQVVKLSYSALFARNQLSNTVFMACAYFFSIMTFYFTLKWVPTIVVDFGFTPSSAAGVLVWANIGGAIGGATFGFLAQRYNVKLLTMTAMVCSVIALYAFGQTSKDLTVLAVLCAGVGFFTNSAMVALYAIAAQVFPTQMRASGTGFCIGIGRGGAMLSPILAGYLFQSGFELPHVSVMMAGGSLLAALALSQVKFQNPSA
jgi:benzoate transport